MSYEIIYDRVMVQTTRGVIPMILCGSNNCTELIGGREVKERHWSNWNEKLLEVPADKFLDYVKDVFGDTLESPYECFKRNGKWVYGKELLRWFERWLKKSYTIESICAVNDGLGICVFARYYPEAGNYRTKPLCSAMARTTKDLENAIDCVKNACAEINKEGYESYMWLEFPRRDTVLKPCPAITEPVVVKQGRKYYTGNDGRGYHFSSNPASAVVFPNEAVARNELASYLKNWSNPQLFFVRAETALREKPYAIQFKSGRYSGLYVSRRTSAHTYFTSKPKDAWRFASVKEAERAIKRIAESYSPTVTEENVAVVTVDEQ